MSIISPELLVEDVATAAAWYQQVLGFTLVLFSPETDSPTFARLRLGDSELLLYARSSFAQEIPAFSSLPIGGSFVLTISLPDLPTRYPALSTQVTIIIPLHPTDYGTQECILRDPQGYYLLLSAPSATIS